MLATSASTTSTATASTRKKRDDALFVGYVLVNAAPRLAVSVEHSNHNAEAAGPVVRELLWVWRKSATRFG